MTSKERFSRLPQLLREAERRVNAHVFKQPGDSALCSIPANTDRDVDLLLIEAASAIELLCAETRRSAPETPARRIDPRMVKACEALREILAYKGTYATDKNPTIRAIKRIARNGLEGSPEKTSSPHSEAWTCQKCQQLNSAGTSTCGRCEDV